MRTTVTGICFVLALGVASGVHAQVGARTGAVVITIPERAHGDSYQ